MATTARAQTSGGKPTGQQTPAPARPQAAPTSSSAVRAAVVQGPPRVTLGAKVLADEVDLSSGELKIPDPEEVKEGNDLEVKVRLPGLAEGPLRVRKRGQGFSSAGAQAILLRHPALAKFAAANPMVLALTVKDNKVTGFVGLGTPGPVKGNNRSLIAAMAKGADLLNWAGLSNLTFPAVRNQFVDGVIDVGAENLSFTVGGFLSGTGGAALDNKALAFEGSAKVTIPGGSTGELLLKKDPAGDLSGKLEMLVQIGSVAGTVLATLSKGFVSVMGQVAYSGDRLNGKVTLVATDEATARDITLAKPSAGGDVPIELPGPDKPAKPGKRAYCGWGQLTFRVTDWLAGAATVIINSKGQATIVGEIAPPKEFILFEQKEWIKKIFKLEIRAGYGIPVVGQVGIFANIGLDAIAKVGPGKLYNLKLTGAYSTDPRVAKNLTIEGTLNISAFAGLRLRAEAGLVVTILAHDIKAGVGLDAIAGVRGYVEATPRIGMREKAPGGKREYFIAGHLEIAAQPVLGFSGDLFVAIETPWWSPLSDKRWTWPLFSIEYPLPGEFGIGADVDYVLGSKQWPKIAFGEVAFDSSKFMTDVMNDNTDKGSGGEKKKRGDWAEGPGGKAKGGAKNKGGAGKTAPGEEGVEPIGEEESFSDGGETHKLWFDTKGSDATLMLASAPGRVEKKLQEWQACVPLLYEADQQKAKALIPEVRAILAGLDSEADKLAAMNTATRKAKEVYEKNKGKKGKKGKQGKSGSRDLSKKIMADQRKIRDPLTKLAVLVRKVKFKPVKRRADMVDGKESVEIVEAGKHAGLEVAGQKETSKLKDLLKSSAPLNRYTVGKSGSALIEGSAAKLGKVVEKIAKAPIKGGEISALVQASLEKPAEDAVAVVSSIGQRMRIPNLERARLFVKIPADKLGRLEFKPHPKSPGDELYLRNFVKEMKRQIHDQQRGLNELSVDEWTNNLARFSVDARVFRALDTAGREAVIGELIKRTGDARKRNAKTFEQVSKRLSTLQEQKKLNDEEIYHLAEQQQRLGRVLERQQATARSRRHIGAADRGEITAPDPKILKPDYAGTDIAMDLKIRGRQGHERKVRDSILQKDLERLIATQKSWLGLAALSSELAILHRPDQVAGGYDRFEKLPKRPSHDDDFEGWKVYLAALKKMFGPGEVNSDIGKQWTKEVVYNRALGDVRKAVPVKVSYPIHRLNFTLMVVDP